MVSVPRATELAVTLDASTPKLSTNAFVTLLSIDVFALAVVKYNLDDPSVRLSVVFCS